MKYMDPLEVVCHKCGHLDEYPVADLMAYRAYCSSCNELFSEISARMNAEVAEVREWVCLIKIALDLEEIFDCEMEEEKLDQVETPAELIALLKSNTPDNFDLLGEVSAVFEREGFHVSFPEDLKKPLREIFAKHE